MTLESAPRNRDKELNELVRLERKHDVGSILQDNPVIKSVDGTMLHWTSNVLINSKDQDHAIKNWRRISNRRNRKFDTDFSDQQKEILTLPDKEIKSFYQETKSYLYNVTPSLRERMQQRIEGDHGHAWNDLYERRQKPKRSLSLLRENGINIKVDEKSVAQLKKEYSDEAECPILDQVKNKKIITINGFPESKFSLSIHDTFDHFLLYDRLDRVGVLDRYKNFLQSVGNPQDTDMFNREGELIASVGFEWRSSQTPERKFKPLIDFKQIKKLFNRQELSQNQKNSKAILSSLDENSDEAVKLGSIYSGVLVELMEQRRKHGFIRRLDQDYKPVDILPILDLEYLSLVVDVNHVLCATETKSQAYLFNTEAIVEDYLIGVTKNNKKEELSITISDIENFNVQESNLSMPRQEWLRNNIAHTATRQARCEEVEIVNLTPPNDEYLDLVDEHDKVIGKKLRSQVYKEGLSNFRVVNGFIRNENGQLWIPTRQHNKKIFPNALDFSLGEHVESGESYDQAFKRGLQEELNLEDENLAYSSLGKLTPVQGVSSYMHVYEVTSNEVPLYNQKDFSSSAWLYPDEIRTKIENGHKAKSDLITVLNHVYPI